MYQQADGFYSWESLTGFIIVVLKSLNFIVLDRYMKMDQCSIYQNISIGINKKNRKDIKYCRIMTNKKYLFFVNRVKRLISCI